MNTLSIPADICLTFFAVDQNYTESQIVQLCERKMMFIDKGHPCDQVSPIHAHYRTFNIQKADELSVE